MPFDQAGQIHSCCPHAFIATHPVQNSTDIQAFVQRERGDSQNPEVLMKNKGLLWAIHAFVALSLTLGVEAMGQESRLPAHFNGLIDDYTPSNVKGGPYEMHGTWSLDLHRKGDSVIADFSATLNMETSDYGTQTPAPPATPNVDPTHPETRGPHTHHIALSAPVQFNATGCPTSTVAANPAPAPPPLTTSGFQFTGVVSLITGTGR
ncbi:MAG: hypothetical protein WBF42_14550, partial [Terracidiphilus sp.]